MMARKKATLESQQGQNVSNVQSAPIKVMPKQDEKPRTSSEHVAYAPQERPMSLSQMSHIAPKKFKPQRQKPNVNLTEIRALLDKTKHQND